MSDNAAVAKFDNTNQKKRPLHCGLSSHYSGGNRQLLHTHMIITKAKINNAIKSPPIINPIQN